MGVVTCNARLTCALSIAIGKSVSVSATSSGVDVTSDVPKTARLNHVASTLVIDFPSTGEWSCVDVDVDVDVNAFGECRRRRIWIGCTSDTIAGGIWSLVPSNEALVLTANAATCI